MPRSMSTRIAGLLSLGLVSSLTFPLTNLGGSATWTIAIPDSGLQVGSRLYVQAAVTSPGANAAGIVVSNAGELVLGAK